MQGMLQFDAVFAQHFITPIQLQNVFSSPPYCLMRLHVCLGQYVAVRVVLRATVRCSAC